MFRCFDVYVLDNMIILLHNYLLLFIEYKFSPLMHLSSEVFWISSGKLVKFIGMS